MLVLVDAVQLLGPFNTRNSYELVWYSVLLHYAYFFGNKYDGILVYVDPI